MILEHWKLGIHLAEPETKDKKWKLFENIDYRKQDNMFFFFP